jgi:SAM-dependent methyltransferase
MNTASAVERVYKNGGNRPLISLIEGGNLRILDIGCGSGDNAALLRDRLPGCEVDGITHSQPEADIARKHLRDCWVFDIEGEIPDLVRSNTYDVLIFSHVLEHLRDPAAVLFAFSRLLAPDGTLFIAVPNILSWRMRAKFLKGDFAYTETGTLDVTHLRFFTFRTADRFLLAQSSDLVVRSKSADGSFPLWWLRRYVLPAPASSWIDSWACRRWPNLFGDQVLIKAEKRGTNGWGR